MLTLKNMARVYHSMRDYTNSKDYYNKAKGICLKYLDSDDVRDLENELAEMMKEKEIKKQNDVKIARFEELDAKKEYGKEFLSLGKTIIECLIDTLEDYKKALTLTRTFLGVLLRIC